MQARENTDLYNMQGEEGTGNQAISLFERFVSISLKTRMILLYSPLYTPTVESTEYKGN